MLTFGKLSPSVQEEIKKKKTLGVSPPDSN